MPPAAQKAVQLGGGGSSPWSAWSKICKILFLALHFLITHPDDVRFFSPLTSPRCGFSPLSPQGITRGGGLHCFDSTSQHMERYHWNPVMWSEVISIPENKVWVATNTWVQDTGGPWKCYNKAPRDALPQRLKRFSALHAFFAYHLISTQLCKKKPCNSPELSNTGKLVSSLIHFARRTKQRVSLSVKCQWNNRTITETSSLFNNIQRDAKFFARHVTTSTFLQRRSEPWGSFWLPIRFKMGDTMNVRPHHTVRLQFSGTEFFCRARLFNCKNTCVLSTSLDG